MGKYPFPNSHFFWKNITTTNMQLQCCVCQADNLPKRYLSLTNNLKHGIIQSTYPYHTYMNSLVLASSSISSHKVKASGIILDKCASLRIWEWRMILDWPCELPRSCGSGNWLMISGRNKLYQNKCNYQHYTIFECQETQPGIFMSKNNVAHKLTVYTKY